MTLEMIFLGTGSAFTVGSSNYHSNVLLRLNENTLLIDAGSDVRHATDELGLSHLDIKNVYISHLHSDHAGGLEWLALQSKFDPRYTGKPNLYISCKIVHELWTNCLRAGLRTIQAEITELDTFFNVHSINKNEPFVWEDITFNLVQTVHVISGYELMPCYGLLFKYNDKLIFFTADTQCSPTQLVDFYAKSDIIFHDCETSPFKSGVHAHYEELVLMPEDIKAKMWLYHYSDGDLPDAEKDGFLGFVKKGQVFQF